VCPSTLLLLADECPQLIELEPAGANADHAAIVQLGAAFADLKGKLADGFTVDAGQARRGADADALSERGDDLDLFVAGEDVHGLDP
jgi:hypothetical protein